MNGTQALYAPPDRDISELEEWKWPRESAKAQLNVTAEAVVTDTARQRHEVRLPARSSVALSIPTSAEAAPSPLAPPSNLVTGWFREDPW